MLLKMWSKVWFPTPLWCSVAFLFATSVYAQHTQRTQNTRSSVNSVSASDSAVIAAAAEADTGRMMPGYKDLSRYNTPGYCLGATYGMQQLVWRTGEEDTVIRNGPGDTIPSTARQVGKRCMAAINPQTVAPVELYNLMRLAVRVGDTAMVHSVVERQLSIIPVDSQEARGYILLDAITEAVNNHPMRLTIAEELFTKIKALGPAAVLPELAAYGQMSGAAHTLFDTVTMFRLSRECNAWIQSLLGETPSQSFSVEELRRLKMSKGGIFGDSIELVWYKQIPELPTTVHRLAENMYGEFPGNIRDLLVNLLTVTASVAGTPMLDLPGIAWFPDSAAVSPRNGNIILLIRARSQSPRGMDQSLARYRRLYERYKDRGLKVVLVTNTTGFKWASPPLEPTDEAKLIGWYYRDYLQLPFTVVVQETPFQRKPDGRRVDEKIEFDRQYPPSASTGILVGHDGNIASLRYGFHSEAELDAYIRAALDRKP